jgi:hypothetical protein
MGSFPMPDFAFREVTDDMRFRGGHLVRNGFPKDFRALDNSRPCEDVAGRSGHKSDNRAQSDGAQTSGSLSLLS